MKELAASYQTNETMWKVQDSIYGDGATAYIGQRDTGILHLYETVNYIIMLSGSFVKKYAMYTRNTDRSYARYCSLVNKSSASQQ